MQIIQTLPVLEAPVSPNHSFQVASHTHTHTKQEKPSVTVLAWSRLSRANEPVLGQLCTIQGWGTHTQM